MALKAKLTASLPKLAVTPTLRDRVQAVADRVEVGMSEVVRDCIEAALPNFELQLGLVDFDELSDDDLARIGIARIEEPEEEPAKPPVETNRFNSGWGPDRG